MRLALWIDADRTDVINNSELSTERPHLKGELMLALVSCSPWLSWHKQKIVSSHVDSTKRIGYRTKLPKTGILSR